MRLLARTAVLFALAAPAFATWEPTGTFAVPSASLERIFAQIRAAQSIPQTPAVIVPVASFGDRNAAHWRYSRRDVIFALDGGVPVAAGSETTDVIETTEGNVERLLSVDGADPATPLQASKIALERAKLADEDVRLGRLLSDDEEKRKEQKSERNDEKSLETMVGEFPRALRYSFSGLETDARGEQLVREDFTSNDCAQPEHSDPCFKPTSPEARIYSGMKGQVWVRASDGHLVRFKTTIDHDVTFGWGFVHLSATAKEGGQISIELSDLDGSGKRWVITALTVHLTIEKSAVVGFFTHGTERDHNFQTMSDFQPISALSYDEGIRLLLQAR